MLSNNQTKKRQIVITTGLSGAGMSSALKILEDLGYEIFDNFPLDFINPLLDQDTTHKNPVALGLDTRSRGFSPERLLRKIDTLRADPDNEVLLLYLTCSNNVLQKRFSQTRRGHPLAKDGPVLDGIRQERGLLKPLTDAASLLIDTTALSIHDLRHRIEDALNPEQTQRQLAITFMSFGFKHGLPRESDYVIDARFLDNPHWDKKLRPKTGRDADVQAYVANDPDFEDFIGHLQAMLKMLLPRYTDEGKFYFTFSVGCTGGRHRSVFITEHLAKTVSDWGYKTTIRHRDLEDK